MSNNGFDLTAAARREMIDNGFAPDIPAAAMSQVAEIQAAGPGAGLHDLTGLLWSSIDNDDSRDLDQIEWAERVAGGIRVLVGIADVDSAVAPDTPIDHYAARETTSVYAGVHTFPMLPERLSTDLTSLNEGQERAAMVVDMVVKPDGTCGATSIYGARVRNHAQLTYNAVGAWLAGTAAAPAKLAASAELQAQVQLQDEAARLLRAQRDRLGALAFDRVEAQPVFSNGHLKDITARVSNRAAHLIEDFMIAANETMALALRKAGVSSIRRVVRDPERWPRIRQLAERFGDELTPSPDPRALNAFLLRRKKADPDRYQDLSLSVLKLMGPGEYVLAAGGDGSQGHFGLAAQDYTHSTAPNRRFADLVTQRLVKAWAAKADAPYTDDELDAIARNCTLKENAARKVQRNMLKRMAAVALAPRVGETFDAIVTGVTPNGVFVRLNQPPVEGRVMRGEGGLDVGDRVRVTLLETDAQRGFIDFGRQDD